MRSRSLVVAAAFVLATTATLAVFVYVRGVKADARTTGDQVSVIISKEDIPAGSELDGLIADGAFRSILMPEETLIGGAITSLSQLQGRETAAAVLKGEQIAAARLKGSGSPLPGGTLGIPEGHQAVSLPLQTPQAAGGSIQAGDHVTIYATFSNQGGSRVAATVTLVPDAQILRIRQPADETGDEVDVGIVVTLALPATDTQKVVFAHEEGSLWLSLLPPDQEGLAQPPVSFGEVVR